MSDRHPDRAPRVPAKLSVTVACKEWEQVERLVTQNASRGGLFLRAAKSPPVGATIRLEVQIPDGTTLSLAGTVAHVISAEEARGRNLQAGFGVRLDAAHSTDLLLLEQMALAQAAEAAGPVPALPPAPDDREVPGENEPRSSIQIRSYGPPIAIARLAAPKGEKEQEDAPCTAEVVVSIDYGTSYSSIAAVRDKEAFVVKDSAGRTLLPSIVSYPESGGVLVGWDARDRLATDPAHTIGSAKRLLGRRFSETAVANQVAQAAYRSSAGPNDQVLMEMGGAPLSVPQVAAEVLRQLKRTAERALGVAVEEVVLTVPVSFDAPHRNALRKAAALAGLRVVGLIEEPAAAALAYGFGLGRNEVVAVYDFGGGTFDFTVIDISNELFRILVAAGDAWLGGDDFDLEIAKEASREFWKKHKVELEKRLVEWQRLVLQSEAAKRRLTTDELTILEVAQIARNARGPIDLSVEMTRQRFEGLCEELVQRTLTIVEQALAGVGLDPESIGQVVLTGGVTRIPMVRAAVAKFFGRPLEQLVHPDEAVALGAAVQAALLAKKRSAF